MKIYIDFDGTIYNSTKLDKKFINLFKEYNIDQKYITKLINEIKNYNIIAKRLINKFNLNTDILTQINNIYSEELIYQDVIPFLEKYYKKCNLILLTYTNDKNYQLNKINNSNISKYFKEIIITTKDKSKLNNIDYLNGIFIDNNPIELERFYNSNASKLIRIQRNTDKYSKLKLNINNIPSFKDFKELLQSKYIENLGDETNE